MSAQHRPRSLPSFTPLLATLLFAVACNDSSSPAAFGTAPEPVVTPTDVLPGVAITIDDVRGSNTSGRAAVGEKITVDFTVRTDAGQPLELSTMARAAIMVSGPTFNYQRVIASQADVVARSQKIGLGRYRYQFAVPIPATYLAPLNDTAALSEGELTGQALLGGTYTVGLEIRKDYLVSGELLRDPGNATKDFLLGSATVLEPREVVALTNCNSCHTELRAHGDNRNKIANCLLCHTAGAEDKNVATVNGGTPGVAIDFKVMIHKIHSGKHLPSVQGVATNSNGTRNYNATAVPYALVGFGDVATDFSTVTWPSWPSFYTPMPRDTGFTALTSTQQSRENTIRQGPTECYRCHGDPDGTGPLAAPRQGDLIWSQPSIQACKSCHDDWDPEQVYTANNQTMPIQRDNSACKDCHRVSGTALDIQDAHRHPLVDDSIAAGLTFEFTSIRDIGDGDGHFEPGEKIEVTFQARDNAGNPVAASSLSRIETILSGPVGNPQMITYQRVAQNAFTGNGPYTFKLPDLIFYEPIGTSTGSLETFATARAPHWNVTNAATTLLRRTGNGATAVLAANAPVTQNYIDVASVVNGPFAKDNIIVIDDATVGVREFMKIQWVDGNRLWFSSQFRQNYKPNLKIAHVAGATVTAITTSAVPTTSYTLSAATGIFTETTEFGAGEILASYTSDFVIPGAYPGSLNDSPTNGQDWGDWTGLALQDGTYTFDMHGARTLTVTRSGEPTTYTEGANSTVAKLLFGAATQVQDIERVAAESCYGCHVNLQFHGGSRRSVDACLQCHGTAGAENQPLYESQTTGSFGEPVEFRYLLHRLHKDVFPATPGGVQDCAKCHGSNTAWKQPATRVHPAQTVPTRSWRAACSSCHDSQAQVAHIDANTSPSGAESCIICHGTGEDVDVEVVHRIK